ncbi:hypothetical protein ACVWY2_001748 [Bradyrhizobium sp. JR6.1]
MPASSTTAIAEQRRGKAECRRSADPADQHAAERGSAGESDGARKFDTGIRGRQLLRGHQRRDERRCCDAVGDRAADCDEAEQSEQRQGHRAEPQQQQDRGKGGGAQRLGARHHPAPRHAVSQQACGNRKQDERQRQRGLQQAGLAFADAEHQHGDDGRGRKRNLLGRLRGEVGPGQAV